MRLTVFAAAGANQLKVGRMRALGADVRLEGDDFDAAKDAARKHAEKTGALFVEDGAVPAIAEGAATIALELSRWPDPIDSVVAPLGNGALLNGIGAWFRHWSPETKVLGVCAEGAPSMYLSWRERRLVTTERIETIADGIAVRVPVPESLESLAANVDEVFCVSDGQIVEAMRLCFQHLGLVTEPAGAAAVAGCLERRAALAGQTVAIPICGGNLPPDGATMLTQPRQGA
jgi:threonine dehydratase